MGRPKQSFTVLKYFFIAVVILAMSACATTPINPVVPPAKKAEQVSEPSIPIFLPIKLAEKRHSRFAKLTEWMINGRLGIRQGDEGFSAAMEWSQKGPNFDIRLFDPLGRRVAQLNGNDKHVRLVTIDGQKFEGKSAEILLEKQLGWSFPVQSLFYWVKGTPDPNHLVWRQEYDDLGRLVKLKQGKWQLTIRKYQTIDSEYIPKLVKMNRDDLKVKLLIRDWE